VPEAVDRECVLSVLLRHFYYSRHPSKAPRKNLMCGLETIPTPSMPLNRTPISHSIARGGKVRQCAIDVQIKEGGLVLPAEIQAIRRPLNHLGQTSKYIRLDLTILTNHRTGRKIRVRKLGRICPLHNPLHSQILPWSFKHVPERILHSIASKHQSHV